MNFPGIANLKDFVVVAGGEERHRGSGCDFAYLRKEVHIFDPRTYSWGHLAPMLKLRAWFPLVNVKDKLYTIGGKIGGLFGITYSTL